MPLDRAGVVSWYQRNRERSRALFDLVEPAAYYKRPITLRQPVVFYDGHLPAFSFNTLVKKALGRPSIDARLEALFARGIDPVASHQSPVTSRDEWPSRETVRLFVEEADRQVVDALTHEDLDRPGDPLLDRAEAVFTILEHEAMHQETLLYMWHRLPFADKRRPRGYRPRADGESPRQEWIDVPGGCATLGVDRGSIPFGWDNEFPRAAANVDAFAIDRFDVTNEQFLAFVEAGGYGREEWWRPEDWRWRSAERIEHPAFWQRRGGAWLWHGMFDRIPLPMSWPVYVSGAEAFAFARWRGARLPSESEFQRAAFGSAGGERQYPWGAAEPSPSHGVFDFTSWDPEPAGSHPKG
ncbi:MAG TPA: SUMF1/EgtB/PvdO family nonheme iron enzyme, partial [Vicinamibacterales bacterium]|nr:SUMF1/EgtB/PvdO family nonheme iron enzyme [Vicinamibacterales bacterium]